jgi:hypothetical protein
MATNAKQARAKIGARRKVTKSAVKKAPARRLAAAKVAAPRRPLLAAKTGKAQKSTKVNVPKAARSAPKGKSASVSSVRKPAAKARPAAAKPPAKKIAKTAKPRLTAQQKKDLAAKHLWELVEEKKRRATQPPPWQTIAHHDHPAPAAASESSAPKNLEPAPFDVRGHGDRGNT